MTDAAWSGEGARAAPDTTHVRAVLRDLRYRRGRFASDEARRVQIERLRTHLEAGSLELRIFDAAEAQRLPFKAIAATLGISLRHLYRVRQTMMHHLAAAGSFPRREQSAQARCQDCRKAATLQANVFTCSFDCTFCEDCAAARRYRCPNCGGELAAAVDDYRPTG